MAFEQVSTAEVAASPECPESFPDFEHCYAHEDERHGETRKERYERLLKRIFGYRRVMRLDASPGGYHAGDLEAIRLHKVQEQWYASLDMALAQAERALMGMIETETQYGRVCDD